MEYEPQYVAALLRALLFEQLAQEELQSHGDNPIYASLRKTANELRQEILTHEVRSLVADDIIRNQKNIFVGVGT